MQVVSLRNKKLADILNGFSDWIFSHDQKFLDSLRYGNIGTSADRACSIEYLKERQSMDIIESGYPDKSIGADLNLGKGVDLPEEWYDRSKQLDKDIMSALGIGFNALKMYYPSDGYIGWHHNANCPGQNLIMTYSPPGGAGYFEYQDPITKENHRIPDPAGWSAKVGYFGSFEEPEKIFWHCARSVNTARITVSYVIRDQWMWEEMVQDIESDQ